MKAVILSIIVILTLLLSGCAGGSGFDSNLNTIVKPYRFSIAGWEFSSLLSEIKQPKSKAMSDEDKINTVKQYFDITKQLNALKAAQQTDSSLQTQKDALENSVEKIIEELRTSKISERSGRAQDKENDYTMQKLRSLGYM